MDGGLLVDAGGLIRPLVLPKWVGAAPTALLHNYDLVGRNADDIAAGLGQDQLAGVDRRLALDASGDQGSLGLLLGVKFKWDLSRSRE